MRIAAYVPLFFAAVALLISIYALYRGAGRFMIVGLVVAAFFAHWARNCFLNVNSDDHNNHWWR